VAAKSFSPLISSASLGAAAAAAGAAVGAGAGAGAGSATGAGAVAALTAGAEAEAALSLPGFFSPQAARARAITSGKNLIAFMTLLSKVKNIPPQPDMIKLGKRRNGRRLNQFKKCKELGRTDLRFKQGID
jgi:hypothetical protein